MKEDRKSSYGVFGISTDIMDKTLMVGAHGFIGGLTDKPFGIIKSRMCTTNGYETRKQNLDNESTFLEPLEYLDIYKNLGIRDEESDDVVIIKAFILILEDLKAKKITTGKLYHSEPVIVKGLRNKDNKRLKSNLELWKKLFKCVAGNGIEPIYSIDLDTPPKAGVKNNIVHGSAILQRADEIRELNYNSISVPFDGGGILVSTDIHNYWKAKNDITPLLGFKENIYYTSVDADPLCYSMVNRGKDFINIGRKSEHCGYGYAILKEPASQIDETKDLINRIIPDEPLLASVRTETLRILPGLVLSDLRKYGVIAIHRDVETGDITTMHGKILGTYGVTPAMTLQAIIFIKHLSGILNIWLKGGKKLKDGNYVISKHKDITDQFITENEKGDKIPTDELKDSKGFMKIKGIDNRVRNLMLGSEILERNMLVKLVKKNLKITQVKFKVSGDSIHRIAYIIECDDGAGIYNNWYISIVL